MPSSIRTYSFKSPVFPDELRHIAQPPRALFGLGAELHILQEHPKVAIVGSRMPTAYGKQVTQKLAGELARAGVVILSGLALGVDSLAHQAALEVGGRTVAILPADLNHIYPHRHTELARRIVQNGGMLLSEYENCSRPHKSHFIARNRIIAALADIVIVTEAALKSGSLHTAQFALEQGREVMAVPGLITNPLAAGCNNLLRSGAAIATDSRDVLHLLGLDAPQTRLPVGDTPQQQAIITALAQGAHDGAELLAHTKLDTSEFSQALTLLEVQGQVRPLGNNQWGLI